MIKLYVLCKSRHCQEAEKLLEERNVKFEKIDVEAKGILGELDRELGIRHLPTIDDKSSRYEGIKEIRQFIEKF